MQHYILQIVTGQEQKAAKELEALGIRSTLPMRQATRHNPKNRRKVEIVYAPVLPGYLVITADYIDWMAVRKLKEVIKPIECNGEPQPVSPQVVDYVARLEGTEAAELPFKLQQRVQVLDDMGRPTGLIGTIAKLFGIKKAELETAIGKATVEVGKLEAA